MSGMEDEERLRRYEELTFSETDWSSESSSSDGSTYELSDEISETGLCLGRSVRLTEEDAKELLKYSDIRECSVETNVTPSTDSQSLPPRRRKPTQKTVSCVKLGKTIHVYNEKLDPCSRKVSGRPDLTLQNVVTTSGCSRQDMDPCLEADDKLGVLTSDSERNFSLSKFSECEPVPSDCASVNLAASSQLQESAETTPPTPAKSSKSDGDELGACASAFSEVVHSSEERSSSETTSTSTPSNASTHSAKLSFLGLCLSHFMVVGHVNSPSSVPRTRSRSVNFPVLNPAQETVARDVGRILRRLSDEFTTQMSNRGERRRTISLPADCPSYKSETETDSPSVSLDKDID